MLSNEVTVKNGMVRQKTMDIEGERTFQTYEGWRRACKQIDPNVKFDGDKDICQAGNIGEWDGATGVIYNTKDVLEEKGSVNDKKTKDEEREDLEKKIKKLDNQLGKTAVGSQEEKNLMEQIRALKIEYLQKFKSFSRDVDPIVTPQEVNLMSKEEVVNYIHFTSESLKDDGWSNEAIRRLFERADQFKRGETK